MADKKTPSTRSLIADAEALRSDKGSKSKKVPKTKQLVAESEKLIGREPSTGGSRGLLVAIVLVAALVAAAVVVWQLMA